MVKKFLVTSSSRHDGHQRTDAQKSAAQTEASGVNDDTIDSQSQDANSDPIPGQTEGTRPATSNLRLVDVSVPQCVHCVSN
jgi:hypothetical protein